MGENSMEYKLIDLIKNKAIENVGKEKFDGLINKIKDRPDYVLEEIACDLKLQAFDAVEIIKSVRKEENKSPTSFFFEISNFVKKIKGMYKLKDEDGNILENKNSAFSYAEKIKFIIFAAGECIIRGIIKVNKMTMPALACFVKRYKLFMDNIRNLFKDFLINIAIEINKIIDFVKNIFEVIMGKALDYGWKIEIA